MADNHLLSAAVLLGGSRGTGSRQPPVFVDLFGIPFGDTIPEDEALSDQSETLSKGNKVII